MKKTRPKPAKSKKFKCMTCFDTKEVAYIALPPGKRVRRCPTCSGGAIPRVVLNLIRRTA